MRSGVAILERVAREGSWRKRYGSQHLKVVKNIPEKGNKGKGCELKHASSVWQAAGSRCGWSITTEERRGHEVIIAAGTGVRGRGALWGLWTIVRTLAMNEIAWKRLAIYQTVSSSACEYSWTTFPNLPCSVAMGLSSGQRKKGRSDVHDFQYWPYKPSVCDSSSSFSFCGHPRSYVVQLAESQDGKKPGSR